MNYHYYIMTEQFRPQPENPKQHAPEAGAGPLGLPPPNPDLQPQGGDSKPTERQRQTRVVFNPHKETFEEYKKRYDLAWKKREIEQAKRRQEESDEQREKRRKYNTEYKRRWRQARKQQGEEGLTQQEQE
jgi:hypothetical protein